MKKLLVTIIFLLISIRQAQAWQGWYRYVTPRQSTIITYKISSNTFEIQDQYKITYKVKKLDSLYIQEIRSYNEADTLIQKISYQPDTMQFTISDSREKVLSEKGLTLFNTPALPLRVKEVIGSIKMPLHFSLIDHAGKSKRMYIKYLSTEDILIMGEKISCQQYEIAPVNKMKRRYWPYKYTYYYRSSDGKLMKSSHKDKKLGQVDVFLIKEKE